MHCASNFSAHSARDLCRVGKGAPLQIFHTCNISRTVATCSAFRVGKTCPRLRTGIALDAAYVARAYRRARIEAAKETGLEKTNSRRSVPILGMTSLRANLRAEGCAPCCSTSSAVFGWRLTVTCESRLRSLPPLPRADRNRRAARDRVFRCASCRQHCAPAAKVFCGTGAQPRSAAAPAQMPG
jgi:hypothetical protein